MFPLDQFLTPVVDTAIYRGKLWAVPYTSNAGLLYYRKDLLPSKAQAAADLGGASRASPRVHEEV